MRISVDREKCTGCHLCELTCSLFHLGIINPEKSAIRIQKDDLDTGINTPVVCRQCREMKCLDGESSTKALAKQQFLWTKERAERCPFDSLTVLGQHAYHCDLCAGHPQCVRVCSSEAIYIEGSFSLKPILRQAPASSNKVREPARGCAAASRNKFLQSLNNAPKTSSSPRNRQRR